MLAAIAARPDSLNRARERLGTGSALGTEHLLISSRFLGEWQKKSPQLPVERDFSSGVVTLEVCFIPFRAVFGRIGRNERQCPVRVLRVMKAEAVLSYCLRALPSNVLLPDRFWKWKEVTPSWDWR